MSWSDRLNVQFTITTGDGQVFKPLWKPSSKVIEYNVAEFEFIGVSGTLVYRSLPKGRKFPLEFYFQGDDFLDESSRFEIASRDNRPWKVQHPYYRSLLLQPLGLNIDNTAYNISKITCTCIETINEDNPKGNIFPIDYISYQKTVIDGYVINAYVKNYATPKISDVNLLTTNVDKVYKKGVKISKTTLDATTYANLYTNALNGVLTLTDNSFNAMTRVRDFINAPFAFVNSVKGRLIGLADQFNELRDTIYNLKNVSPALFDLGSKRDYEAVAGILVSSLLVASITNIDYANRTDVIDALDRILAVYNQYIADLDDFQSPNGGDTTSYIPDFISLSELNALVNYTISSLFTIGLNSKQERVLYLEKDSNLILLAHRLYGLSPDDSEIATLKANNNIGLSEILQIAKGRKIIYYV